MPDERLLCDVCGGMHQYVDVLLGDPRLISVTPVLRTDHHTQSYCFRLDGYVADYDVGQSFLKQNTEGVEPDVFIITSVVIDRVDTSRFDTHIKGRIDWATEINLALTYAGYRKNWHGNAQGN